MPTSPPVTVPPVTLITVPAHEAVPLPAMAKSFGEVRLPSVLSVQGPNTVTQQSEAEETFTPSPIVSTASVAAALVSQSMLNARAFVPLTTMPPFVSPVSTTVSKPFWTVMNAPNPSAR